MTKLPVFSKGCFSYIFTVGVSVSRLRPLFYHVLLIDQGTFVSDVSFQTFIFPRVMVQRIYPLKGRVFVNRV